MEFDPFDGTQPDDSISDTVYPDDSVDHVDIWRLFPFFGSVHGFRWDVSMERIKRNGLIAVGEAAGDTVFRILDPRVEFPDG